MTNNDDTEECPTCRGYGWSEEHFGDPACHDGNCWRCPQQVPCHYCGETGQVVARTKKNVLSLLDEIIDMKMDV